jgi:wee1-like protein kinase
MRNPASLGIAPYTSGPGILLSGEPLEHEQGGDTSSILFADDSMELSDLHDGEEGLHKHSSTTSADISSASHSSTEDVVRRADDLEQEDDSMNDSSKRNGHFGSPDSSLSLRRVPRSCPRSFGSRRSANSSSAKALAEMQSDVPAVTISMSGPPNPTLHSNFSKLETVNLCPNCSRRISLERSHNNPFSSSSASTPSTGSRSLASSRSTVMTDHDGDLHVSGFPGRYVEDFEEIKKLGKGSYGCVTMVRKRLDGMTYAVKKISKRFHGERSKEDLLYEVYALSALDNPHVIRYFNSWIEDEHLYVQMELCEGGSLAKKIGEYFSESALRDILRQILEGLAHIHGKGLVHLDIKNENIYCKENVFKIGDLGQIRAQSASSVSEGDGRYLCRELLEENYGHLPKADIFALGVSIYELLLRRPLPGSGPEWHAIRDGHLYDITQLGYSAELFQLLRLMMFHDPTVRPSAAEILCGGYMQQSSHSVVEQLSYRCMKMNEEIQLRAETERTLRLQLAQAATLLQQHGLLLSNGSLAPR